MPPNNKTSVSEVGASESSTTAISSVGVYGNSAKLELLYEGVYYDISNWIHRHPGGNIIKMYASSGDDATHAVQQFHNRSSKRVMGIMKSLPQRLPTATDTARINKETLKRHRALDEDFLKLFAELKQEGLFDPSLTHTFFRCLEVVATGILSLYIFQLSPPLWLWTFALLLGSLSMGRSSWVMHEGGHHSLTGRPNLDRLIHSFFIAVPFGLSAAYWTNQHSRHHAGPQHVKYDVDLKTLPLVLFNKDLAKTKPRSWSTNWFIRNQKWIFFPFTTVLVSFAWRFILHPLYALRKQKWIDITFMIFHHWLAYRLLTVQEVAILTWLSALYNFGNFTLSHTHLPVTNEPTHWVEYSLVHTMNVRSGWMNIVDYWMGYLNYQIEHHLFPTMPQFRNKLCRDRVKALAKKHELPYHLASYSDAVKMAWTNLNIVSQQVGN